MNEHDRLFVHDPMDEVQLKKSRRAIEVVAGYLDEDKPGWVNVLVEHYGNDLGGLYVSDGHRCVLTAVIGKYDATFMESPNRNQEAIETATACYSWHNDEYRELWLAEVTKRFSDA